MSRKIYLTETQIEDMLDIDMADDEESEGEEDIESESAHSTDTEQELLFGSDMEENDGNLFDTSTVDDSSLSQTSKTKPPNIIRFSS